MCIIMPPIYWCLACCSDSYRYLCNKQTVPGVVANIERARKALPEIYFTIECYHYETRVDVDDGEIETD